MKMKEYYLDFKLSEKIYDSNKNVLEINKCYNNVFNIITTKELVSQDIKVCYGFIYRKDLSMFNRHCFIILGDRVVDPTALFWDIENVADITIYYPFKTYEFNEYLSVLSENNRLPDLYEVLLEEEIDAHNRLILKKMKRNVLEEGEFLQRVYGKNLWEGIENYNKNNKLIIK